MAAGAASFLLPAALVDQSALGRWAVYALTTAILAHLILLATGHGSATRVRTAVAALISFSLLATASVSWLGAISRTVPEPYLDEAFHIPQAQRFCRGKYGEWDDKITTPPGLYLISLLLLRIGRMLGLSSLSSCDVYSLRSVNALSLLLLAFTMLLCRQEMESQSPPQSSPRPWRISISAYALHTALNIALFPLLFFFSGLYYTDVLSTAVVAAAFFNCLVRMRRHRSSVWSDTLTFIIGILAILMRQTNVFWIVVYMGGLEAVHAIKCLKPTSVEQPHDIALLSRLRFNIREWSAGAIYDPPLSQAWPEDMLLVAASLTVAVVCNAGRVIRQVVPYVAVLSSFAAFVAWNGGVVLGDKSNHVATIHLAQMLYIWPLFAFFSMPLLLPHALCTIEKVAARGSYAREKRQLMSASGGYATVIVRALFPLMVCVVSAAVVHYNTIIHPFTLADNRHYMFYVFRYTILRAPAVRYLLIAPYMASLWMVWMTMAGGGGHSVLQTGPAKRQLRRSGGRPSGKTQMEVSTSTASSTALILLVATGLSLVTAPLVEPRYFILPWVMWRLLVPAWSGRDERSPEASVDEAENVKGSGDRRGMNAIAKSYDGRLIAETAWFLAINAVTCYVFLAKPYVWRAEDGTVLDEGRLQRFMW